MFLQMATFTPFRAKSMQTFPPGHLSTFLKSKTFFGGGYAFLHSSGLFIWQRLGRLRPRRSTQPRSNSWCSQQHFLFLPKRDRVALTLSPLEAT